MKLKEKEKKTFFNEETFVLFRTEIHKTIEREPNRENWERIARSVCLRRFVRRLDFRQNFLPKENVRRRVFDKFPSNFDTERRPKISKSAKSIRSSRSDLCASKASRPRPNSERFEIWRRSISSMRKRFVFVKRKMFFFVFSLWEILRLRTKWIFSNEIPRDKHFERVRPAVSAFCSMKSRFHSTKTSEPEKENFLGKIKNFTRTFQIFYATKQIDVDDHRHQTLFEKQTIVFLLNSVGFVFFSFPPQDFRWAWMNIIIRLKNRREKDSSQTSTCCLRSQKKTSTVFNRF